MKNKNYRITIGFATGAENEFYFDEESGETVYFDKPSWFTVTEEHFNTTKQAAIKKTRLSGYLKNDDICTDWVFNVEEIPS